MGLNPTLLLKPNVTSGWRGCIDAAESLPMVMDNLNSHDRI